MSDQLKEFKDYRQRMNERILELDNRVIKRVFSVDSLTYASESRLQRPVKELLGLVASLVLRCDDCVKYHVAEALAAGSSHEEIVEAMSIGLVVGGTIVIPHMRRAVEFLDQLEPDAGANSGPDGGPEGGPDGDTIRPPGN